MTVVVHDIYDAYDREATDELAGNLLEPAAAMICPARRLPVLPAHQQVRLRRGTARRVEP
jgi:hypothetical protein